MTPDLMAPSGNEGEGASGSAILELIKAVDDFHVAWFPDDEDPNAVQNFWFAAKYPRERKRFRKICAQFARGLSEAGRLLAESPLLLLRELDCRTQLRLCIFIDQQSRNQHAIEQDSKGVSSTIDVPMFSDFALALAKRVVEILFAPSMAPSGSVIIEQAAATAAQVCFFTLAFRHSRLLPEVRVAQQILDGMSDALAEVPSVVTSFQRENLAVLRRLEAEAYAREASQNGEPEVWAAREVAGCCPSTISCLAPELQAGERREECLQWIGDQDAWARLEASSLCKELAGVLSANQLLNADVQIVLSFSGGVDSTAHLLLLLAVLRPLPLEQRPSLRCLMLLYPNRSHEEVEGEKEWAAWTCRKLGVELHGFSVHLTRPHGEKDQLALEDGAGLTREEYERYTKEIRFRMYRSMLACDSRGAVVLGHHLDDLDENRLDHLQKGHVVGEMEGMRTFREVGGVPLLRPLLSRRKSDFQAVLASFPTPFFRDSTPAWSVRGSTRAVLDSLDPDTGAQALQLLDAFGTLAAEVGEEVEAAIASWMAEHVRPIALPKGAEGLLVPLSELLTLDVGQRLLEVSALVERLRAIWNPAAAGNAVVGEIPESQAADAQWFLFQRGFLAAAERLAPKRQGHYQVSENLALSRKAVRHLYDNARDCRKPHFGGGLTQELGYVYVAGPPRQALVLYDAVAHAGVDFKGMRDAIVKAVGRI